MVSRFLQCCALSAPQRMETDGPDGPELASIIVDIGRLLRYFTIAQEKDWRQVRMGNLG